MGRGTSINWMGAAPAPGQRPQLYFFVYLHAVGEQHEVPTMGFCAGKGRHPFAYDCRAMILNNY